MLCLYQRLLTNFGSRLEIEDSLELLTNMTSMTAFIILQINFSIPLSPTRIALSGLRFFWFLKWPRWFSCHPSVPRWVLRKCGSSWQCRSGWTSRPGEPRPHLRGPTISVSQTEIRFKCASCKGCSCLVRGRNRHPDYVTTYYQYKQ